MFRVPFLQFVDCHGASLPNCFRESSVALASNVRATPVRKLVAGAGKKICRKKSGFSNTIAHNFPITSTPISQIQGYQSLSQGSCYSFLFIHIVKSVYRIVLQSQALRNWRRRLEFLRAEPHNMKISDSQAGAKSFAVAAIRSSPLPDAATHRLQRSFHTD